MSESPRRRQGHRPAGARARLVPAEAHEGTAAEFLRRHELEAREATGNRELWHKLLPRLLDRIADPRNLKLALDHLDRRGDRRVRELDSDERWELARVLGRAIRDGQFRPGPGRKRQVPKVSGTGTRTLSIPDYADRAVERAVVQILPLFLDTSLGYRPGKGRAHALALAEHLARTGDRWVWIAEDLATAFDLVPQRRLIDVVRHYLPAEGVVRLVELLVVTKSGKGLRQGGPLSPLLLNFFLHHLLDRPWRTRLPDVPLIRVADDVAVLCRSEQEASKAYAALKQIVGDCGMRLKGSSQASIRNLKAGDTVSWLGCALRMDDDQLRVELTDRTWQQLERRLQECHTKPDPPLRAVEVLRGWVGQLGPAYPSSDHRQAYARVTRIAVTHGFEELPVYEEFMKWWEDAHGKWERRRKHAGADDRDRRLSRGSARAEAARADSGPTPGGPPERGAPPGTSSPTIYELRTAGSCPVDGERGEWTYSVSAGNGGAATSCSGTSPHTTRERMELLAVLRGLEAVPAGAEIRLLVADGRVAAHIDALIRGTGADECFQPVGTQDRASDLWHRLAAALTRYEVVLTDLCTSPTPAADPQKGQRGDNRSGGPHPKRTRPMTASLVHTRKKGSP